MKNIKLRKEIIFQGIALLLIVILGLLYVRFTWISTENDKFEHALQIARSIAATLPKEDLKALEAKPGDIDKPQYQMIKNALKAIISVNADARFAYLYTEQNGKIFFIADSEPVDSKDYSPPGQEYTEAKPEDKQPFRDGKELITDTMSDRWGTWTSVLIPINDANSGKTIAVFGMDFNAKVWDKNVLFEVIESSVIIELLLLTFFFLLRIRANNKSLKLEINERRQAENVLRKSEEKYRYLFANNPQPMWIYDLETLAFLEVNQAALNHYGYSKEEFLLMTIKDIRPAEDIPALLKDVEQTKNDYNLAGVWRHCKKNGELIFVEITSHSVIFNGRNARHVLVHDITERKQAEEAVRESQSLYHSFLEQLPNAVFRKDREGRYVLVNSQFCKLKGLKQEDLIGKKPLEVAVSEIAIQGEQGHATKYANLGSNIHEQILQTGKSFDTEEEYTAAVGGKQYMHIIRMPVFDSYGTIIGTQGIMFDITERKRAEKEITMLAHSLKSVNECVSITDLDDKILFVNELFSKTYGYDINELIGKHISIVSSQNNKQEQVKEISTSTILGGWQGELLNKRSDGSEFPIFLSTTTIKDKESNILGLIGVATDISERKRAEKELIVAKERAEESDNLKTAFLNNISHEIRTPFNGILGFLSLLQDDDMTANERDEYISIINKSAYRLMNTINDIVEISQIQAGQIKLSVTKTNIRKLTSGVYTRYKSEAESNGLKFFIKNDLPNNLEFIHTDGIKLNAILSVLILNAIKFTKTGSIQFGISLTDTVVETHGHASLQLQFSIKDTGVGISKSKQHAIFERFMQADGSNTRSFEGSGLGLSIAKAYVEMLGGKIWVESEEGEGSVFYFTIPYMVEPEEKDVNKMVVSDKGSQTQHKPLKILIAEDDEESAILLELTVKVFSKEVIKVRTGVEAIEACRNNPDIDMILMDIKMPDMNGHEATRQIRQFNRDVVIIAQTAYALTGDREKSIAVGCNDYISKPIKKEQLVMLVEKYFKKYPEVGRPKTEGKW